MWLIVAQLLLGLVAIIRGHHVVRVIFLIIGAFLLRRGFGQLGFDPVLGLVTDVLICGVFAYMIVTPPRKADELAG